MGKTKTKVLNQEAHKKPELYEGIFDIVENGGNFYIGVAGKLVTPKNFSNAEEARIYIDSKPWDLIINVSCLCMDLSKTNKK